MNEDVKQVVLNYRKSATSIVICVTPDVLLKMLISKEQIFQGKVVVILDEFEESDYVTEFLLIGLKDLFKVNPFLRLIIMTNANDVSSLYTYFSCPKTEFDTSIQTATISSTAMNNGALNGFRRFLPKSRLSTKIYLFTFKDTTF